MFKNVYAPATAINSPDSRARSASGGASNVRAGKEN